MEMDLYLGESFRKQWCHNFCHVLADALFTFCLVILVDLCIGNGKKGCSPYFVHNMHHMSFMQWCAILFLKAGLPTPRQLAPKNFHDVLDSLLSESELELTFSMVAPLKFHDSHKFCPSIRSASAQIAMMTGNQINKKTTWAPKTLCHNIRFKGNIFRPRGVII